MNKQEQLITEWWNGYYALGWRGWLAKKLLKPVIKEILVTR